jgi:hypothetical protein
VVNDGGVAPCPDKLYAYAIGLRGTFAKMYRATGALLLLLSGFAAGAEAQPVTLTLACNGTTTAGYADAKPEPISMGVILNLTARTVQGYPGLIDIVKITAANDR